MRARQLHAPSLFRLTSAALGLLGTGLLLVAGLVPRSAFGPRPALAADEVESRMGTKRDRREEGWSPYDPGPDPYSGDAAFDLRSMNESFAGEHGFIIVQDGNFIHAGSGREERFWGVNGPPWELEGASLRRCARMLAKRGVNLVRIHHRYFDSDGEVDRHAIDHAIEIVEAMKAEGIYSLFSIYYTLWFTPGPNTPWLEGYDGKHSPFAALEFNPAFQAHYRAWWKALLTTPSPRTSRRLVDDPAVMGAEIQNEDSLLFWSFGEEAIPDAQLRVVEREFGAWLARRYGSLEAALGRWELTDDRCRHLFTDLFGLKTILEPLCRRVVSSPERYWLVRDVPREGRVGFRPWNEVLRKRALRDEDAVRFLFETQQAFYADTYAYLRALGFRGVITASNWRTASPEILDPLENLSYTPGDFIDRHGYFDDNHEGPQAEWSLQVGHTYSDRSALRFDGDDPAQGKSFADPAMEVRYDGKPSTLSETAWNRPNRYRSEAPLFLAAFGALAHTNAIVHFQLDGDRFSVQPQHVMQPWTLMSPAMIGQFPAAALLFRRGLVASGAVLADVDLNRKSLFALRGTTGGLSSLDPLVYHAGRVEVRFTNRPAAMRVGDLGRLIDRASSTVTSSTGELKLDYRTGFLKIDAPCAQGVSGRLKTAGPVETRGLEIASDMEVGHLLAVSLDGEPLDTSARILLQVMSEERTSGFRTTWLTDSVQRIEDLGHDPWQMKDLEGRVRFKRRDASELKVAPLDDNGYPVGSAVSARSITLAPATTYYLITR